MRLLRRLIEKLGLLAPGDYDPATFWTRRHRQWGMDPRGVGHVSRSRQANESQYAEARLRFLELLESIDVRPQEARVLDIGCGNGFYAGALSELGVRHYRGIDIADVLLPTLRERFPNYRFDRLDVAGEPLDGEYDLVILIDVAQHIVDEERFAFAMGNIASALADGGTLVVTYDRPPHGRRSPHVHARGLDALRESFPDWDVSESLDFRDKSIVALRKPCSVPASAVGLDTSTAPESLPS